MERIIALMTDFGYSDGYIGVMKGIILSINPNAIIVDLAHNLPKFNIRYAAFVLYTAYKYFPKNTIFVCVIDPGVGTSREAIIIKTRNYFFIGPNNGLFSLILKEENVEEVRKIENRKYMMPNVSVTFHGRDIFAPAAAYLSLGIPIENFGTSLTPDSLVMLPFNEPEINLTKHEYSCEILAIDSFGNVITNIPGDIFSHNEREHSVFLVKTHNERHVARRVKTYGEGRKDELLVLIGSHGFVELAINKGSAKDRIKVKEGDKIVLQALE